MIMLHSLVVQNNVRFPYPVGRYSNKLDTSKFFRVPFEFIIIPNLKKTYIGGNKFY